MKDITIARALKEKAKLIGRIAVLQERLYANNSYVKDNVPAYDTNVVLEDLINAKAELVLLKAGIAKANIPVVEKIYMLSEKKGLVQVLKNLNTNNCFFDSGRYNSSELREYIAVIKRKDADDKISVLEQEIQDLQDELDAFNVSTYVKILENTK